MEIDSIDFLVHPFWCAGKVDYFGENCLAAKWLDIINTSPESRMTVIILPEIDFNLSTSDYTAKCLRTLALDYFAGRNNLEENTNRFICDPTFKYLEERSPGFIKARRRIVPNSRVRFKKYRSKSTRARRLRRFRLMKKLFDIGFPLWNKDLTYSKEYVSSKERFVASISPDLEKRVIYLKGPENIIGKNFGTYLNSDNDGPISVRIYGEYLNQCVTGFYTGLVSTLIDNGNVSITVLPELSIWNTNSDHDSILKEYRDKVYLSRSSLNDQGESLCC